MSQLLPSMPLTKEVLKEYEFGKVVNKLTKHGDQSIAGKANALKTKWSQQFLQQQGWFSSYRSALNGTKQQTIAFRWT